MKTHELGLQPIYYQLIKNGTKIYEGRLNDEKRKLINIGDEIIVKKDPERTESFVVTVVDKLFFCSFREMAEALKNDQLGLEGMTPEQIANVYRKFYSKENEEKYGVVALKVEVKN